MASPNEASPGYVALIRIADFILSPQDVLTSFNNFCTDITEVHELNDNPGFSIYPNPGNGTFYLTADKITGDGKIQAALYNPSGKIILQKELNMNDGIKVPDAVDGIYFLRITSESYTVMKKIIIAK